ncbi:MAG: DoxX family protein [Actinomycetota bacterium]
MTTARRLSLVGLVALMAGAAMIHFLKPEVYFKAVPRFLGPPEPYVLVSGLAELGCAALLAAPRTRRLGGYLTAGLLLAVFPANIQMALDGPVPDGNWFTGSQTALWLRLPLQPVLIWWAFSFARRELREEPTELDLNADRYEV